MITEQIKRYTSYNLLSYDFLHDNKGQLDFFKHNKVYNLNYLTEIKTDNYINEFNEYVKFKINDNLLIGKITGNIEKYVENIMTTEFINKTEHYFNTADNIKFKYNNK